MFLTAYLIAKVHWELPFKPKFTK